MSPPAIKRLFDIVASSAGMVILFPPGLLIALLIKLSDGGPIFYGQTRIGQFGTPFIIWKFRSMVVNAEKMGALLTGGEDPRITRLGRFLRNTKLDELPQLWNVLKGDMSLVGPRPEVPPYVAKYTPEQREVLRYRPGITDAASLLFRKEEILLRSSRNVEDFYLRYCLPKKLVLNRQYAERATLLRDIWIILQTIFPSWLGALMFYTVALIFSFWLSCQLRSDFRLTGLQYEEFQQSLLLVVLPQVVFLAWQGQLRALLSYFSEDEMRRTLVGLGAALVFAAGLSCALPGRLWPASSILLIDFIVAFFVLGGVRTALRLLRERASRVSPKAHAPPKRVAMIGTGELATNLVVDFARSANPVRQVVAFFDDNPHAWHKRPHNIPVIGMPECLLNPEWFRQIDEVIVTLPEKDASRIQQIGKMLKGLPLQVTIVSGWPRVDALNA